ncbi:hypothetical protein LEMLEM_LOCUS8077 [Lemmus lemmus]
MPGDCCYVRHPVKSLLLTKAILGRGRAAGGAWRRGRAAGGARRPGRAAGGARRHRRAAPVSESGPSPELEELVAIRVPEETIVSAHAQMLQKDPKNIMKSKVPSQIFK